MSTSSRNGPLNGLLDGPPDSARGRPRGLAELIAGNSPLGALAREATTRLDLADTVRNSLPPDLAAAISTCNLRPDGTLVVTATSPDWAARLRFEGDTILAGCRSAWPAAERVRVRTGTLPP